MTKSTMGTKLPRKLEQKMQIVGEQIRLTRLCRNLCIAQDVELATCSPLTVSCIRERRTDNDNRYFFTNGKYHTLITYEN